MSEHPLEKRLILWIVAQLMIKVEPERRGQVESESDERRDRKRVPPREQIACATPPGRLLPLLRSNLDIGYDRSGSDRGYLGLQRQQLRVQVLGIGRLAGWEHVPTGRLACRVNTRNRHSIGEPNRGW
ncbi:MAG: hypothetical protein ABW046_12645 [Actinoplanes sp.]